MGWFSGIGDALGGVGSWLGSNADWLVPAVTTVGGAIVLGSDANADALTAQQNANADAQEENSDAQNKARAELAAAKQRAFARSRPGPRATGTRSTRCSRPTIWSDRADRQPRDPAGGPDPIRQRLDRRFRAARCRTRRAPGGDGDPEALHGRLPRHEPAAAGFGAARPGGHLRRRGQVDRQHRDRHRVADRLLAPGRRRRRTPTWRCRAVEAAAARRRPMARCGRTRWAAWPGSRTTR